MMPAVSAKPVGALGRDAPEAARHSEPGDVQPMVVALAWASLAAALLPLIVAAVRAVSDGWVPVGDAAIVTIRARDIVGGGAGEDVPLLGMWASTSWSVGFDMNHPGPLLSLALAVPTALVAGPAGVALGTALVSSVSVLGMFAVAWRRGGALFALAAMAVTAALCWSFGSAVLVEPWHATTVLLPFLLFCLLAWSVACGDLVCLPLAAVVGSLVLQTNLGYALLVPVVLVACLVGLARVRGGGGRPWVWLGAAALGLLMCWLLPLAEQLTGDGRGNLSRLVDSVRVERDMVGFSGGVRTVARVLALPPWWGRPSYADAFRFGAFGNSLPSLAVAAAALVVVVGVLAWRLRAARRTRRSDAAVAVAGAGLLVVLALATAAQTPTSRFGTVAYQLRWLWPVGGFIAFAVIVSFLPRASDARFQRWAGGSLAAATLVLAAATLPVSDQGTTAPASTLPVARGITEAVAAADLEGPVLVTCAEHVFDPYCEAVMAELQRRDVPFVVDSGIALRQLGEGRRWDGTNAVAELTIVAGDFAVFPPAGVDVIALHQGLDEDERLELSSLRTDLSRAIADGTLRLNERGRRLAQDGALVSFSHTGRAGLDAERLVEVRDELFGQYRRDLVAIAREDLVDVGAAADRRAQLDRYADLQIAWDDDTVAVWLGPVPEGGR
jgi:hypothetical protein